MSIRVEMDLCLKCRTARFKGRKGNANEEKEKTDSGEKVDSPIILALRNQPAGRRAF